MQVYLSSKVGNSLIFLPENFAAAERFPNREIGNEGEQEEKLWNEEKMRSLYDFGLRLFNFILEF